MKIKKYRKDVLQKCEGKQMSSNQNTSSFCSAAIALPGTFEWKQRLTMLIDSGASMTSIPKNMLSERILGSIQIAGQQESTLADGKSSTSNVVFIDMRIETILGEPIVLQNVPVSLMDTGDEALLGSDILILIDFSNIKGQIVFIKPASKYFELEDVQFGTKTLRTDNKRYSNIDPSDNEAKPAEASPASPNLGIEVPALKDAFGRPSKPQPPKRSR